MDNRKIGFIQDFLPLQKKLKNYVTVYWRWRSRLLSKQAGLAPIYAQQNVRMYVVGPEDGSLRLFHSTHIAIHLITHIGFFLFPLRDPHRHPTSPPMVFSLIPAASWR